MFEIKINGKFERERVKGDQKLENKNHLNFGQKIFFLCLLVFIFGLGFGAKASAATIYIDPTCATPGDGTSQACSGTTAPKQTWASVTWIAGNTYLQKAGTTATETVTIGASGVAGNVITMGKYGAGNDPIITDGSTSYVIYETGRSYLTFQNLDIRATRTTGQETAFRFAGTAGSNIVVSNCTLTANQYGINGSQPLSTVLVENTNITTTLGQGVYFYGNPSSNITISGGTHTIGNISLRYITNPTITGVTITNTPPGVHAIYIQDGAGIANVTNNNVINTGIGAYGINFFTGTYTSGEISSNTVTSKATSFEYDNITGPLTSSNNIAINGTGNGYKVSGTSSNLTFNNDVADSVMADGFVTNNSAHDITFNYCRATNCGNKSTTAEGDGFTAHDTNYNLTYNYCISDNNTASGWCMVGTSAGTVNNSIAYNNASNWTSDGGVDQVRGGFMFSTSAVNPTTGTSWVMRNSIGVSNYPVEIHLSSANKNLVDLNYNLYNEETTGNLATINDLTSKINWATYHGAYETNSFHDDPIWQSMPVAGAELTATDFILSNTSPAINAGTNVGLTTDYAGNSVPSGPNSDFGVYEFQDSTDPITSNNITAGTYNSVQSITLTCDDGAGVGCDKIYYTLDGTDPNTDSNQYSGAISTPDNATTVLKYFSRDRNENAENIKSRTYTIDTIAPNTTINSNPGSLINTNSANFTFSASETAIFQCKIDSGAYASCTSPKNYTSLAEGAHTFYVKATDTATNEDATPASYTFTVDTEVPTISDLSPNNTTLSVTTTSTNLTLTTSENTTCKYSTTSGTDYASMTVFDSTNNTTHSTALAGLNSGTTYGYYIKCKDAINEFAEEHLTFSIAPEENKMSLNSIKIKIERETNKFKDKIYSWKNKFKLKGDDSNLANGTIKIYKDGKRIETVDVGNDGAWSKILKLKDNFSGWIKVRQYDQYGTLLGTKKVKVKVDTEKPEFTSFFWPLKSVVPEVTKLTWEVKDNDKIDKYKIYVGGRIYTTKFNTFQIPRETARGIQYIKIKAYDKAGNTAFKETYIRVR